MVQSPIVSTQAVSPPESFNSQRAASTVQKILEYLDTYPDKLHALQLAGSWSSTNGITVESFLAETFVALHFKALTNFHTNQEWKSTIDAWRKLLNLTSVDFNKLDSYGEREARRLAQQPQTSASTFIQTNTPTVLQAPETVHTVMQNSAPVPMPVPSSAIINRQPDQTAMTPPPVRTPPVHVPAPTTQINPRPIATDPDDLMTIEIVDALQSEHLLNTLGENIAALYRNFLNFSSVQFVPNAINHLRVIRLIFKCKLKDFTKFRQMSSDAALMGLKYLGINNATIVPGLHGVFEIQVPKPEAHWESLKFTKLLDYNHSDKTIQFSSPCEPPKLPVGVDLEGNRIYLNFLQPILYAGMTRSGKSNLARQVALQFALRYHPEWISLMLIDMRKKTFAEFNGLPHLWDGRVICSVDEAFHALRLVMNEYKRRDEIFADNGVDSLWAYNKKQIAKRQKPLPIWFINIEEIDTLKYGQGKAVCQELDLLLEEGVRTTSGNGLLWMLGAHTPTEQSITTDVRDQSPTRVLLHSTEHASEFILDRKGVDGKVGANLVGKGDCWIRYMGSPLVRAQLGHVSDEALSSNLDRLKQHYSQFRPSVLDPGQDATGLLPGDVGYPTHVVPSEKEINLALTELIGRPVT